MSLCKGNNLWCFYSLVNIQSVLDQSSGQSINLFQVTVSDGCSEEEHNIICQVFINETVAHNLEEIENGKHEKWIII